MNKNFENSSDQNIVLKDILERYVRKWKWFVISAFIALMSTYIILRYVSPLFLVKSSIKIKDESGVGGISEMAVLEDKGMFIHQKTNVINEIEVLESRNLLAKVVKSLDLNIKYSEKGKTFYQDATSFFLSNPTDKEIYSNNPINIDFFERDSLILRKRATFEIKLVSLEKFQFKEIDNSKPLTGSYGKKISTSVGDIIITPNVAFIENYLNKTIEVKIVPLQAKISSLKKDIEISSIEETDIINLSIQTGVKQKGIDILNYLIIHYNQDAVDEKAEISKNTSEFISNRLKVVSEELSEVDKSIEEFRKEYNIIDLESQTGIELKNDSDNQQRIIEASNQLSMVESMEAYISSQNNFSVLPEVLGFSDVSLSSTIERYNGLVVRRNELLKSVNELHPAIVNLDEELVGLKTRLKQSITNIKNSLNITIDGLNKQDLAIDSKLFSSPKKEREFIDISRQQAVKETLYLYLLEKREEITISLGITKVNAKIIDAAYSSRLPIYPQKQVVMLVSLLIGLIIPFLTLYLSDLIDTRVHRRSDIDKELNIPFLGEIPFTSKKEKRILAKDDRSGTAEAFRLVRTNLEFMLANNKDASKVITVTSTIGNEGKSFIALNLAKTIATTDKKVLLLGLDLRAPTISKTLKLKKGIGVTHFITDSNITLKDIINPIPNTDNLDLIISGIIPPNPAELLMSERLEVLFSELKEKYDYIIVDTSPLSLVTDTLILNKFSSLFVYVVRADFLDRRMLNVPKAIHAEKKLSNMSILINGIKQSHNNYGYGYGYGNDAQKPWYKKNV